MLVTPRNERVSTIRITFILRKSLCFFRSLNTFIIYLGLKRSGIFHFKQTFEFSRSQNEM